MTLIACGVFFPPLIIPGLILSAISGAIKLSRFLAPHILDFYHDVNTKRKIIAENKFNDILEHDDKGLTHMLNKYNLNNVEKARWMKAYQYSQNRLETQYEAINIPEQFFRELSHLSKSKRNTLLDAAENKMVDDEILERLKKHAGDKAEDHVHLITPVMTDTERKAKVREYLHSAEISEPKAKRKDGARTRSVMLRQNRS